jgi:flagellar hook-associated protein 1 FlgK
MSAGSLMSLGVKAMAANYAALQTTGHNIANANVAGYSRQTANMATSQGQFTGGGFFGRGVDVVSVTRAHDAFLTGEAARAASLAAMDGTRLTQLNSLETVFKTGEQGLGYAVGQFLNSMADLANQPADSATRQVVLTRAADMAARFSEAGKSLDSLQDTVTTSLNSDVTAINSLAKSIAGANQKIAAAASLGQPANDLLDERDRLIGQLSQYIQVSRIEAGDGSTGVFIAGGQRLVLGGEAGELRVMADPADPQRMAVGMVAGSRVIQLDPGALGGGSVTAQLRFQNADLSDARGLVGRLAATVGTAVNQQQVRGLNLNGSNPAPPLFGLRAPAALGNIHNAVDASGQPLGSVALSYSGDPGALRASDYDLRQDPANPGAWKITRIVGGQLSNDPADSLSFTGSSATFQGVTVDMSAAPPAPGDRFLLQTVSRSATDMSVLLRDPRDLAAASPLVASTAASNTGTAAVSDLFVTASPLPVPGATVRLSFIDNSAADPLNPVAYTFELLDSAGAVLSSDTTPRPWRAGQAIPDSSIDLNGFSLTLTGVPRPGDTLDVAPTPAAALATNNGNARAMLALRDAALVDGKSATDGYAQALADVGSRVQAAQSTSDISTQVASQAEQARSSKSGVSLDEEAARMIQYQQSYQAAAKMLTVAQALFDTLLRTTGG